MRVFTFISGEGATWSIAQRIVSEGHRAVVYINNPENRRAGDGLIEKSRVSSRLVTHNHFDPETLKQILEVKPDCIIVDGVDSGYGKLVEYLKSHDYTVFGGGEWSSLVNTDSAYGMRVVKMMGLPIGNSKSTGVKIATGAWYNGSDVVSVFHVMDEKTLMEGGIGPKTRCMGSVVWSGSTHSKLYAEGMSKLIPVLKNVGFKGQVVLGQVIDDGKLKAISLTVQIDYNSIYPLLEMYKGRINDLFYGIASGVLTYMEYKSEWGIGVNISVLPYPMQTEPEMMKDVEIKGLNKYNLKHIWFYDVYKPKNKYLCSGNGGSIGVITARGDRVDNWSPIRDCKRRAHRTISNISVEDMMYRRDIGDRVRNEFDKLTQMGWLT